jgi:hypothetical protein
VADEPRTVYAVTSGEYSDYCVLAVFDRREDAEHAVRELRLGDDWKELILYPAETFPRKVGWWSAYALVLKNGDLEYPVRAYAQEDWTSDPSFTEPTRPHSAVTPYPYGGGRGWNVNARAMTEEAAVKSCSDAVAKLRAEILEREALKPKPGQKPRR